MARFLTKLCSQNTACMLNVYVVHEERAHDKSSQFPNFTLGSKKEWLVFYNLGFPTRARVITLTEYSFG